MQAGFRCGPVVCLVCLLVPLQAPPASTQEPKPSPSQPVTAFPAQADLVVADAVVLDKRGTPVSGLTRDDFAVTEDGLQQPIATFEAVELPESAPAKPGTRARVSSNTARREATGRFFAVVLDDVHLSPQHTEQAKDAIREFLATGPGEGDEVVLASTSGGAWWSARMRGGADDLVAFLERFKGERHADIGSGRMTDWEAVRLHLHRDVRVGAEVVRRYYENGLLADIPMPRTGDGRPDDIGEGHPQIRAEAAGIYRQVVARNAATLRTLERVMEALAPAKGRKVILLVSGGFVHDPAIEGFREVLQAARRSNAAVYFVDARGLGGLPLTGAVETARAVDHRDLDTFLGLERREAQGSESVAADSGGFTVRGNALADGMRRIAGESRSYYLIGYQPTNARRDGKFRKIGVQVKRPDVEVRARKGYYAPSDGAKVETDADNLDPAVRQGLDSPVAAQGISLRMISYVFAPTGAGKSAVLLAAEADPGAVAFKAKNGLQTGAIETFLLVTSRQTGETQRQERLIELSLPPEVHRRLLQGWLPILRNVELPPGVYQARLLLRDRESGRLGTVKHDFEVPPHGELRVSTPVLTDTIERGPGGAEAPPRPVPLARRSFASGATVHCLFEVYGAAKDGPLGRPQVSAGYLVKRADGTVYLRHDPTPIRPGPQGEVSQSLALSLRGAAAGGYELQVTIRDEVSGKTLEVGEPFEVTASPMIATP